MHCPVLLLLLLLLLRLGLLLFVVACQNPSNVHLLKLYESGLPPWAVVLPSYGLWYRPWLRKVVGACLTLNTRY
jgi:hypothetical protein